MFASKHHQGSCTKSILASFVGSYEQTSGNDCSGNLFRLFPVPMQKNHNVYRRCVVMKDSTILLQHFRSSVCQNHKAVGSFLMYPTNSSLLFGRIIDTGIRYVGTVPRRCNHGSPVSSQFIQTSTVWLIQSFWLMAKSELYITINCLSENCEL